MSYKIAYILPSYRCFEYARRCIRSLHKYSPDVLACVVDDNSPDWDAHPGWYLNTGGPVRVHRYTSSGGLTRSWNEGFRLAHDADVVIAGNNDVLFHKNWHLGLLAALDTCAVAGPLSNAPGVTAADNAQHVSSYVTDYRVTDSAAYNDALVDKLWKNFKGTTTLTPINGFFMAAKLATWRKFSHSSDYVFPPQIKVMPSGRINKTPLMTGQEDWLCARVRAAGSFTGVALGSFIFHYRSVARGKAFAKGDWRRIKDAPCS